MYLEKESERTRTIISGAPLSAEKIRMMGSNLGSEWNGTSWFFLQHLIAKELTRSTEIPFEAVYQTVSSYGIIPWLNRKRLIDRLDSMTAVFRMRGLGNVYLKDNGAIVIDGKISRPEFRNFATSQYAYAMGEGLMGHNWDFPTKVRRPMSDFAERILWHYIMSVFDGPKVHTSPRGENHLSGLYHDITEKMQKENVTFNGVKVWDDLSPHTLSLLVGWERNLLSKNVLKLVEFGNVTFVAPSFYSEIDRRILTSAGKFSSEKHEVMLDIVEKLHKLPAYPVMKGTHDYEVAKSLQRAGAIKIVEDSKSWNSGFYVYLVSRDIFETLDREMKYEYSDQPFKDFGDSTITDLFYQSLGRARLFGEKILPEVSALDLDFKTGIDKLISDLEEKGTATIPPDFNKGIFAPLVPAGAVAIVNDKISVNTEYGFFINRFADYWNELINDPSLLDIRFPPDETVSKKETSQTENQIKKNLNRYF